MPCTESLVRMRTNGSSLNLFFLLPFKPSLLVGCKAPGFHPSSQGTTGFTVTTNFRSDAFAKPALDQARQGRRPPAQLPPRVHSTATSALEPRPLGSRSSKPHRALCLVPRALPPAGSAPACPARLCLFCHSHVRVFRGTTEAIRSASRSGVRLTALRISFRARHAPGAAHWPCPCRLCD